jgi:hypothetical protein
VAITHVIGPPATWREALPSLADDGGLHVLCPAGVGDFLWIWTHWHAAARERERVTFHFPDAEQHRAHQYLQLLFRDYPNVHYSFLPGLTTQWVWGQPGDPAPPEGPGVVVVQANRHLEAGRLIEEWCPDLPFCYPEIALGEAGEEEPRQGTYVLCFTCHLGYMRGNLPPAAWARLLGRVEQQVGPVRLVGAGKDVAFGAEVRSLLGGHRPEYPDLWDRPFPVVLAAARGAVGMLGVAGGPIIAAQVDRCPSLIAYPSHLYRMPGSWENPAGPWDWCFVSQLEAAVASGRFEALLQGKASPTVPGPLAPPRKGEVMRLLGEPVGPGDLVTEGTSRGWVRRGQKYVRWGESRF